MMTVLFFADYRERLNCARLQFEEDDMPETLSQLCEQLSEKGDVWREVLSDKRTLVAINHTVHNGDAHLRSGDEVAFFPPVTGG